MAKTSNVPSGLMTTGQAAELTGLAQLTLRRWIDRGALKPRRFGRAKGSAFGWSVRDIVAARALAKLRERRSAQQVRQVVKALTSYGEDLASAYLVEDAAGVFKVLESGDLLGLLNGGQVRAVALAPIMADIRTRARAAGISLEARKVRKTA